MVCTCMRKFASQELTRECQRLDVNYLPRLQVMIEVQSKLATQCKRNALTMFSVSMLRRGIALHQRVNLSTIVKV